MKIALIKTNLKTKISTAKSTTTNSKDRTKKLKPEKRN
jgi:hypothetical protein